MLKQYWNTKQFIHRLNIKRCDISGFVFNGKELHIQVWNQLPADVLGTLSCKPSNFRKRIRKVITKAKLREAK
jgi:hypothetical protein